uniref:Engulfment and cell motility 3 n=1 Tax=Cyprinus carpio TaxID=7962 RepID=A0A8C2HQU0_CYPCA
MPGAYPQLIQLDQKKPLTAVIKEVCDKWNLPGPDNYALQYADGIQTYITESNRIDIKNGSILRLTKAPGRCAEDLYKGIQSSDSGVRCDSLKLLADVSTDITFAQEFISRDGHSLLVKIVEDAHESVFSLAPLIMTHTLSAFMELMDHGIVSWENLSSVFIKKIASFVNAKVLDTSIQQVSLAILESMVLSSSSLFNEVKQEITLERLISHLQVTNQQLQTKAMALLMAMLLAGGEADRQVRGGEVFNIIHSSSSVGDEMAHYLYVLQTVRLNHLEARMRTPLDSYNQEQRDMLHGLRQAAFEMESESGLSNERRRSLCAKEFKKLGFSNNSNPGLDLSRCPPGLLALDTMAYFASRYPDAYSRFVLENSSREDKHECPFARSSIQLTLILCEILRIGEPLFKAIQGSVSKAPITNFTEYVTVTLALISLHHMHFLAVFASRELKERLKPELLELIRQQRLNRLCHGTLFRKISSRRRQDKLWYCRLSPNHKVLHYGDVEEQTETPSIEALQEKIPVADIKNVVTGKDCPHMKENKGKQTKEVLDLAFSITYDVEEYSLNFIASSRTDFCLWTDGLSVLLGKEMSSESMHSELEILLSMEIKLRLLDLENVPIPDTAPPIPKPPSNFNFCYDFSQAEQ